MPEEEPRGPARWPLRTRLLLLLAAAGILMTATLVTQLLLQDHQRDVRNDLLNRIDPARVTLAGLRAAVLDQETGVRGFLLTRNESFLEPYERGRDAADAALDRLHAALQDDEASAALAEVEERLATWRSQTAVPSVEAGSEGAATTPASEDQAQQQFESLRAAINEVDAVLDQRRVDAIEELDAAATGATVAMILQVVGLVASGVLIAVGLTRLVTRPLARLGADARTVASGDLAHEVRGDSSPDLVRLGADVDAMRRRIVAEVDLLNAATADLARQAEELARSNDDLEQFAYVASTTSRSRCARCRASASCSRCATPTSSTSGPTSISTSQWTGPSACRT